MHKLSVGGSMKPNDSAKCQCGGSGKYLLHGIYTDCPWCKTAEQVEPERCEVCNWPLAESEEKGCVRDNCSQRPRPSKPTEQQEKEVEYYAGKGCKCAAYNSDECGCPNVDWTPKEVYTLRAEKAELQARVERLEKCLMALLDEGFLSDMHDVGCPEDDTCDCVIVKQINESFKLKGNP